jgi:hypothetical protein
MKKIFFLFVSLICAGEIALLVSDTWKTTTAIQRQGVEGTLKIERQYNASRWAEPVPIKKIHTYSAILAPNYEIVVETDQELTQGKPYFIRFLTRDKAQAVRAQALRPITGTLRQRLSDDVTPPALDASAFLDRLVDRAMGTPAKSSTIEPTSGHEDQTVPFLLGGANDSMVELIWNNSAPGEWILLFVLVMLAGMTGLNAIFTPWRKKRPPSTESDFVHPAMRKIEADKPTPSPQRLKLAPKTTQVDKDATRPATTLTTPSAMQSAMQSATTSAMPPPLKLYRKPADTVALCATATDTNTKKAAGDSGGPA